MAALNQRRPAARPSRGGGRRLGASRIRGAGGTVSFRSRVINQTLYDRLGSPPHADAPACRAGARAAYGEDPSEHLSGLALHCGSRRPHQQGKGRRLAAAQAAGARPPCSRGGLKLFGDAVELTATVDSSQRCER